LRWIVLVLAFVEGGWLAFDGAHGLITGDYVTPSTGTYAGQLGPWSHLVEAVGLEPRSHVVMAIRVALGAVWLGFALAWARRASWAAWSGMIACAIGALWYLPFGTLLSVVQIGLLWRWAAKKARAEAH
jgi:hypothetical protein